MKSDPQNTWLPFLYINRSLSRPPSAIVPSSSSQQPVSFETLDLDSFSLVSISLCLHGLMLWFLHWFRNSDVGRGASFWIQGRRRGVEDLSPASWNHSQEWVYCDQRKTLQGSPSVFLICVFFSFFSLLGIEVSLYFVFFWFLWTLVCGIWWQALFHRSFIVCSLKVFKIVVGFHSS